MNNLIRVVAINVATEPRFTSGQIEVITSKVLVITMTEYMLQMILDMIPLLLSQFCPFLIHDIPPGFDRSNITNGGRST
jgi:hypothetical protein